MGKSIKKEKNFESPRRKSLKESKQTRLKTKKILKNPEEITDDDEYIGELYYDEYE